MTRQKKEIVKKINDLYKGIAVDEELGCGFAPSGAYDSIYRAIEKLEDELAHLSHYADRMAMMFDTRWQGI